MSTLPGAGALTELKPMVWPSSPRCTGSRSPLMAVSWSGKYHVRDERTAELKRIYRTVIGGVAVAGGGELEWSVAERCRRPTYHRAPPV